MGSGDTKKATASPAIVTDDATNYKRQSRIATTNAGSPERQQLVQQGGFRNSRRSWPSFNDEYVVAQHKIRTEGMVFLPVRNEEVTMSRIATTKLSSKGQVVIPEAIRERLGLKPGTQFVVLGDRDTVILKTIIAPAIEQFDALIAESHRAAKKAGLSRADISAAVKKVRSKA